jgi:hypothetical protein
MAERRSTCGLLGLWLALAMSPGFGSSLAFAQEQHEASTSDLAKAAQNPIADMISVPFQNNFNFHVGPHNQLQDILNIQPVIPITLDRDWNLITRWITPVISQPPLTVTGEREFGLGDINPTFFFSPSKPSKLIWGFGPTATLPTATDSQLGSGRWSAGPAAVALIMDGPWVTGALVNNQWSFAGWGPKKVNAFLIQPFLNFNLAKGWYLTSAPIMTADWTAIGGQRWTLPVGGGAGKLSRVGKVGLPVNVQLAAFYNAIRPDEAADWQLRFQIQFLFPK